VRHVAGGVGVPSAGLSLPRFPRACLRQSLALYSTLTRLGYPVTIRFGVHKAGEALHGQSRVTVQGTSVVEATPVDVFYLAYLAVSSP
jgi:hypothetical protein